jgi:predicted transcriptional regulator
MIEKIDARSLRELTAEIVSAHVSNNAISMTDLPGLMQSVYASLAALGQESAAASPHPHPAVPIRRSVGPDYLICLEDGKKLKMLRRHLRTAFGMTPDQYRLRWGLPSTYPMVAPNYAKERSRLAKAIGLGTTARRKKKW